ncbi:hypothetical protein JB92DRAFT_3099327 [Gautieria morchelliformis]|nr:hypothetical protein JB92DRAFT_3099327 [Gautieria morchelliformis]
MTVIGRDDYPLQACALVSRTGVPVTRHQPTEYAKVMVCPFVNGAVQVKSTLVTFFLLSPPSHLSAHARRCSDMAGFEHVPPRTPNGCPWRPATDTVRSNIAVRGRNADMQVKRPRLAHTPYGISTNGKDQMSIPDAGCPLFQIGI